MSALKPLLIDCSKAAEREKASQQKRAKLSAQQTRNGLELESALLRDHEMSRLNYLRRPGGSITLEPPAIRAVRHPRARSRRNVHVLGKHSDCRHGDLRDIPKCRTRVRRAIAARRAALVTLKGTDLVLQGLDFLLELLDLAAETLLPVAGTILALAMMMVVMAAHRFLPKALIGH
jgi:hypothetical protein